MAMHFSEKQRSVWIVAVHNYKSKETEPRHKILSSFQKKQKPWHLSDLVHHQCENSMTEIMPVSGVCPDFDVWYLFLSLLWMRFSGWARIRVLGREVRVTLGKWIFNSNMFYFCLYQIHIFKSPHEFYRIRSSCF